MDKSRISKDGKRMWLVPDGHFLMGTSQTDINELRKLIEFRPDWCADEQPQRRVYLDAFYMDETPVTYAEYKKFLDANRGYAAPVNWNQHTRMFPSGRAEHPVTFVSWNDAYAYAQWAGKRLPTEAEWEKAARGTDERRFPWGRAMDPTRCNSREGRVGDSTPVFQFSDTGASPYGIVDLAGNVWEWCADGYAAEYYTDAPLKNPMGALQSDWRVLRGGAWDMSIDYARCASRDFIVPDVGYATVGFRCVMSAG